MFRVIQINGADAVAFQALVDSRQVIAHGFLLDCADLK
jgi:hypothetical protein